LRDGALLVDAAGAAMRISLRVKEMPSIKRRRRPRYLPKARRMKIDANALKLSS
jgi:hypothetical protein